MRIAHILPAMLLPLAFFGAGCAEETSKDHVVHELVATQNQLHADQAMYIGDKDGYHYIHLRDLYSCTGDHEYKVPASQWAMADTFPLTDDADHWRNVSWADSEVLRRLRISYTLLDSHEQVAAPSTNTLDINAPRPLTSDAGNPASDPSVTAPTTQPAPKP